MNDWARVLQHTKRRVNPYNFEAWFRPTRLKGTDDRRLLVRVPTPLCKKRLTETYGELLQAVLQEVGLSDTQLEFLCSGPESPPPPANPGPMNAHKKAKNFVQHQNKRVTIDMIQKLVGWHFGVFHPDFKLKGRSKAIVFARQVAMYLGKLADSLT